MGSTSASLIQIAVTLFSRDDESEHGRRIDRSTSKLCLFPCRDLVLVYRTVLATFRVEDTKIDRSLRSVLTVSMKEPRPAPTV